jgi:hypothetical protein
MASDIGFLLVLKSGAGGYIAATSPHDARRRASFADGDGWLFRCEGTGRASERHRRSRPVVMLRLISTVGRPDSNAMAAALETAGARHCVAYMFAVNDDE